MKNKRLSEIKDQFPILIQNKIDLALQEDPAFAADELVELSEAILHELAAVAFGLYLGQAKQKEVFNDFLIQLFTSKAHAFNAGPLFRWAAHMIRELDTPKANQIKHLFWEADGHTLNQSVNQLSLLRNKVMHGFFVLPPETNKKEATHITSVLDLLLEANLFKVHEETSFHFLNQSSVGISFSGHWNITEEEWNNFAQTHQFGNTAQAIQYQLSSAFDINEKEKAASIFQEEDTTAIETMFKDKEKGAYAVWESPYLDHSNLYLSLIKNLNQKEDYTVFHYELSSDGITYTSDFLLQKIIHQLNEQVAVKKLSKDPQKAFKQLCKGLQKQIILVLNNIHLALFHPNHLLNLVDLFYEHQVILIGFGHHHPYLDQFFNKTYKAAFQSDTTSTLWKASLDNYLRFKGPNKEMTDELDAYKQLQEIGTKIIETIKTHKQVVARRFADKHEYPIEYVHELFGVLHPFFNASRISFEMDELDELYGFPKELTESSSIFFALGRRDSRLEYQHKVLSI